MERLKSIAMLQQLQNLNNLHFVDLLNPPSHLHSHYFPFLVGSVFCCDSQLPLSIPYGINNCHELFFLSPFISLCLEMFPDLAINLNEILCSYRSFYTITNLLSKLFHIIWWMIEKYQFISIC